MSQEQKKQLLKKRKSNVYFNLGKLEANKDVISLLINLVLTCLILGLRQVGLFQISELSAYDLLVRLGDKSSQDRRLLLVEITDSDIKNQNRWPLSDGTLAQLLGKLQESNPAVIGLDIYRDITHPPGTKALQKQLQQDNVISIEYLGSGENRVVAPAGVPRQQIGFNDVVLDWDNKLRRNLMYARLGEEELYSFGLRLSLAYLEKNASEKDEFALRATDDFLSLGKSQLQRLKPNSGSYRLAESEALGWQILVDYQSSEIVTKVNLTDVLAGKVAAESIANKVVIIGTTAPSINDFFLTPYGGQNTEMAGAIAHAQMVSQIIALAKGEATQTWFFPEVIELIWIACWSFVGLAIAIRLNNPVKILFVGISGIIILWGICWVSFGLGGWIPFVPTAINLGLTMAGLLCQRMVENYYYDSLTGLPNQTLFLKQLLKLSPRQENPSATIMVQCIDLDRFKMINDALGYQAGDTLLVTTANRLRKRVDRKAIIARVGGDEFAIAQLVTDEAKALELVQQLQQELNIPFDLQGLKTSTTITTGIALQKLPSNFEPKNILRSARTAMYKAKASGKLSHQVFTATMHEDALKRLQLEADLYQAIAEKQFELYYQPIIDLETETIAGFEALIRWISPERGFVSPGAFIPLAEETGAIIPLGEWILKEACNQMYKWHQEFPGIADTFISVNLSGRQFSQSNLVAMIESILQATGLSHNHLKLEITESMIMDNVDRAIAILDRLKALGIRLSLDDFGTGFSSFSYLHRFPMDTLKIDRSFVSNMNQSKKNFEIVTTIALLAHKLGMDIVAEGIELKEEKNALKRLNCEYGQGYLFAKPLSVRGVVELLGS